MTHLQSLLDGSFALLTSLVAIILIVAALYRSTGKRRQEYIPGVPIIGVEGNASLADARERFRNNAKEMLLDGYTKVRS